MFGHQHNFIEQERFYAEPVEIKMSNGEGSLVKEFMEKCSFGQTTILYKCCDKVFEQNSFKGCGLTRTEIILGRSIR